MPTTKKTNDALIRLISDLRKTAYKNDAPIWKDIAKRLEKPNSSWAQVNVKRLAEHTKYGDTVIVPGKLLGDGELKEPITVAAYSFSQVARQKIEKAGGAGISILDLAKKNPKGTNVRIIG